MTDSNKLTARNPGHIRVSMKPGALQERDFVVASADGNPIHPDRLSKLFQRAVKNSGGPRIRLHDYADLSVMPTLAGDRWLGAKSAVLMSA